MGGVFNRISADPILCSRGMEIIFEIGIDKRLKSRYSDNTNCTNTINTANTKGGQRLFTIDVMSRIPVYEQIIKQVENHILIGLLRAGDKMPSVRSLSVNLSVNPNTIQKAYSELERRHITMTVPGKGSFISENAADIINQKSRGKLDELQNIIKELFLVGVTKDEIIQLIDQIYQNKERKNND